MRQFFLANATIFSFFLVDALFFLKSHQLKKGGEGAFDYFLMVGVIYLFSPCITIDDYEDDGGSQ